MAKVSTNISIDPTLKEKSIALFSEFGLDLSTAISLFLQQCVREKRIPFEIRLEVPNENDARSFIESDVISCPIRSGEALTKDVSANFLADSYAACVNYYYHGFYYSKVSYIPSIANNSSYQVNTIMIF